MKYRCVSYPQFEPDHTWLRQILLFVDEVHRIVPVNEGLKDSDQLKQLMDHCEGTIFTIKPESYVEIPEAQAKLFGKALDDPKLLKIGRTRRMVLEIGALGEREWKDWEFLHMHKIGSQVRRELMDRNMIRSALIDDHWELVPRGVGGLVVGMVADKIARERGLDAITDQPMAYALNGLYNCGGSDSAVVEGVIASAICSVHVPRDIIHMTASAYAELRERHTDARREFGKMVRELKGQGRLERITSRAEMRRALDDIAEDVGRQMVRFRKSRAASRFQDWVPLILTSLFPVAIGHFVGKETLGTATGAFSFAVRSISNLTKKSAHFTYPKVLQTLCAATDAVDAAALRRLTR